MRGTCSPVAGVLSVLILHPPSPREEEPRIALGDKPNSPTTESS